VIGAAGPEATEPAAARRAALVGVAGCALFAALLLLALPWGLPSTDSWSVDSVSPRACALGAVTETYVPGHFFRYPPLHLLLLNLLSLPLLAAGAIRHLPDLQVVPEVMTPVELLARLVAGLMALGTLRNLWRMFRGPLGARPAGPLAAALCLWAVALDPVLLFYGHTGNLDVPALFWSTWALAEWGRVVGPPDQPGEAREGRGALLAALAVLTKDQAAFVLLLPAAATAAHLWRRQQGPGRVLRSTGIFAAVYLALSGALVNPAGFGRRIAYLLGPASQEFAGYPPTLAGRLSLLRDAGARLAQDHGGLPLWLLALGGLLLVLLRPALRRDLRLLLPALGALSFTLFFNLAARRSEDRFLLPQAVLLLPYAGLLLGELWQAGGARRSWLLLAAGAAAGYAGLQLASAEATLLYDARPQAERLLRAQADGASVLLIGGNAYLPRLDFARGEPAGEPLAPRLRLFRTVGNDLPSHSRFATAVELDDPARLLTEAPPDLVVLSLDYAGFWLERGASLRDQRLYDDTSFRTLLEQMTTRPGSLGYEEVLRAACAPPWPLSCSQGSLTNGRGVLVLRRVR
jgi:hypothetical protein